MAPKKPASKRKIALRGVERWLYLLRAFWRPVLSFVYVLIVLFDFIIFPMGWSMLQTYLILAGSAVDFVQWTPITLSDSGLFHVVMGSFIGITSFTRSLEKRTGAADKDLDGMMMDCDEDLPPPSNGQTNDTNEQSENR